MLDKQELEYLAVKRREIIDNCPECHGTKPFCNCAYRFRLEINKASANIPVEYRTFTMDKLTHPELQQQKKAVEKYIDSLKAGPYQNLLITGGKGLAKSACACAILTHALMLGKKAFYFSSLRGLMSALYKENKEPFSTDSDVVALKRSDVIVIDGFGYGFIRERSAMTELAMDYVNQRMLHKKHTIFVSGVPLAELGECEADIIKSTGAKTIDFKGFNFVEHVLAKVNPVKKVEVQPSPVELAKRAAEEAAAAEAAAAAAAEAERKRLKELEKKKAEEAKKKRKAQLAKKKKAATKKKRSGGKKK